MANPSRRGDAFYFGFLVVAVGLGGWLARSMGDAPATGPVPDFSMPGIELEIPFELPAAFVGFRRPEAPRLELGHDTERVITQVRHALLESSERDAGDLRVRRGAENGARIVR